MIEWLGIEPLFELSQSETIWGFFTPLIIFAVFFAAQVILPARKVPGHVINPETGEPRNYRLNGSPDLRPRGDRVGRRVSSECRVIGSIDRRSMPSPAEP